MRRLNLLKLLLFNYKNILLTEQIMFDSYHSKLWVKKHSSIIAYQVQYVQLYSIRFKLFNSSPFHMCLENIEKTIILFEI